MNRPQGKFPKIWLLAIAMAASSLAYLGFRFRSLQMNDIMDFAIIRLKNLYDILNFDPKQLLLGAAVSLFSFLIEIIFVGWKNSGLRKLLQWKRQSVKIDFYFFLLASFNITKLLAILLTFGITYFLFGLIAFGNELNVLSHIENPLVQFLVLIVVGDLINYWRHRISHKFDWYWELHKYHHSADTFSLLTTHRTHFIEDSIKFLFDIIPYVVLGASAETYLGILMFKSTMQHLQHSNIESDWGLVGRYLLVSPSAHRVHHSMAKEDFGRNFGSFLIIWDRVFGTYKKGKAHVRFGVPRDTINESNFIRGLFQTYKSMLQKLVN